MCGIAGYINLSRSNFILEHTILEAMQKTLSHRGPDGYRIWTSEQHGIGIIHRRLSIVDLSDAGFQPMFDAEKTIAVCCNGEIYNHKALRKQLENIGYRFYSHSDTEVIVYAYKEWGMAFLDKLEGMFAIVIFDMQKNELYLVRDRIGVKPLYFSVAEGILGFASEIKALWHIPGLQRSINELGLYHYLTYMVTPAPYTLYNHVYKLPPAFYLKLDAQRNITFKEWYSPLTPYYPLDTKSYTSETECIETLDTLLNQAVEKRLMADVPLGVFLSGGIDSSLLVALMAQHTDKVKTFNVSWDDGIEFNETQWARTVSQKFNTEHHEIAISEKDAFAFFENMVYYQDEPLADCVCVPLYYVSKLLKDSGVTVVLVGEGSDELFCGYASYVRYLNTYNTYWKPSHTFVPTYAKKGLYYAATKLFPQKQSRLDMMHNWAYDRSFFWSGAIAFAEQSKKNILQKPISYVHDPIVTMIYPELSQGPDSHAIVAYHTQRFNAAYPADNFLAHMQYLELKQRLPELLLMRVDKMTMATSVEGRVPFLDPRIVEYALHMPDHLKYKNNQTKYILKKVAEKYLPHSVIYRPKLGFAAPISKWFKTGSYFKPYLLDMLHTKKSIIHGYFDTKTLHSLYSKNAEKSADYSLQLWTLQNVLPLLSEKL